MADLDKFTFKDFVYGQLRMDVHNILLQIETSLIKCTLNHIFYYLDNNLHYQHHISTLTKKINKIFFKNCLALYLIFYIQFLAK